MGTRGPQPIDARERVMQYVRKARGCWLWTGLVDAQGYGFIRSSRDENGARTHHVAHRLVYEMHVGPVPQGHDLHHKCENRACVDPNHLRPMPHGEHQRSHGGAVCRVCGAADWKTTRQRRRDGTVKMSRRCRPCANRYAREHA